MKSFPGYLLPYIKIGCYQHVNFQYVKRQPLYLNVSYGSNVNAPVAAMYCLSEIQKRLSLVIIVKEFAMDCDIWSLLTLLLICK